MSYGETTMASTQSQKTAPRREGKAGRPSKHSGLKRFSLRLSPDLHQFYKLLGVQEKLSINDTMVDVLANFAAGHPLRQIQAQMDTNRKPAPNSKKR